MNSIPELRNWSVVAGDPYLAPEMRRTSGLVGQVYGSDEYEDGAAIALGLVVAVSGPIVTISDGSEFRLVDPEPEYLAWLDTTRKPFDHKEPFKLINNDGGPDA